jgi:hypothetical protein
VLAVLTRLGEQPKVVRRILDRIAAVSPEQRDQTLAELFIVAGLRDPATFCSTLSSH